jgi:hypothetical protein
MMLPGRPQITSHWAPPRFQRDRTAVAAHFAACTAIPSGERDISTDPGVLGAAAPITSLEPDCTTCPSVYIVHATVPALACFNLKSRRGIVTVDSAFRTIDLDGSVKNYGLERSGTLRTPAVILRCHRQQ